MMELFVEIVNFKHILHFCSVSIVDFEQVNVSWVRDRVRIPKYMRT